MRANRNCARGDDHDLTPAFDETRNISSERGEFMGSKLSIAGERTGANLYDDALRLGDEIP